MKEIASPIELIGSLAESLMLWDAHGMAARAKPGDRQMSIRGRLLQCLLREVGDPDWRGIAHYFRGVRLGVNRKSPRTLAVFSGKKRWRLEGQAEADNHRGRVRKRFGTAIAAAPLCTQHRSGSIWSSTALTGVKVSPSVFG